MLKRAEKNVPFEWLKDSVPLNERKSEAQKAYNMYLQEIKDRAGLLFRLNFPKEEIILRIKSNILWEWELHYIPKFIDKIEEIVKEIIE